MTRKIKLNILVCFLSLLSLGWGIFVLSPALENYFYWSLSNSDSYLANLRRSEQILVQKYSPIRNWEVEEPTFQGQSVLAIEIDQGQKRQLLDKNSQHPFAIASLTKLMTAIIAIDNYPLDQLVTISQQAVDQLEETSHLKAGDQWFVEDLLRMSLIESSNDAAYALAEIKGVDEFVQEMNAKAVELGMKQARFFNPTGLEVEGKTNLASSQDLINLTYYLLTNPSYQILEEMIGCQEFSLFTPNGEFHHQMANSHHFLGEFSYFIGGKTGFLPNYGGSLLSIFKKPCS